MSKEPEGDCGAASIALAMDLYEQGADPVVCHGWPVGTGEENFGRRFWHAWVEVETVDTGWFVLDTSNGRQVAVPRPFYYAIGRVEDGKVQRFPMEEAARMVEAHGHSGPWLPEPYEGAL